MNDRMPQLSRHDLASGVSRDEVVEEVSELVRRRVAAHQQEMVVAFVRRYYGQVAPEDLAERDVADLYGAALSHLDFARRRAPGTARVRAYNPTLAEHGWQSTHTVIEIVNDDMPFLVDSVTMEVNRRGVALHLLIHPLIPVRRSADGMLESIEPSSSDAAAAESLIHVEVDRIAEPAELEALAADVSRVLAQVRAAVTDWPAMRARVQEILRDLESSPPPLDAAELAEGRAFLEWVIGDHYTFLGSRSHDLVEIDGEDVLRIVPGSALGTMRLDTKREFASGFSALPPEARTDARRPQLLVITKSTVRSTVHRPGYLDYIGVKLFGRDGQVRGEHRFLGLFTSTAYSASPSEIPLLRHKTAEVLARSGLPPGSHSAKALAHILDTYPRDALFQTSVDELVATTSGILHLGDRQRFRLFVRRDPWERFVSCLIFTPRDRYNTEIRRKWQAILLAAYDGSATEFNVQMTDTALARIHIIVRTRPGQLPAVDERDLERRLGAAARRWEDELDAATVAALGESRGAKLRRKYATAFPAGYRDAVPARAAVADIEMIEGLGPQQPFDMQLYRPLEAPSGVLRFKVLRLGDPLTLSASLPLLERMGLQVLDEQSHHITPEGQEPVWLHDLGLRLPAGDRADVDVDALRPLFEDAFSAVQVGDVENDDFNRLVIAAGIPVHEIVVLRAYAKYMRQIGFALSQSFIEQTLATHPGIARALVALFKDRFDPDSASTGDTQVEAIEQMFEKVANLSEDRVLRQLLALILATNRTNFFRRDGDGRRRSFLSFKFDPSKVPDLPMPRPKFEIFVYSTRFEGVHLRGGSVARGGLRWSDRPEDFRTEVLGLVKAQIVKNTVIVPVGSKGGFVLKRPPPAGDRDALLREGVDCYKQFLRGLLDLTDNRQGTDIVPPPQVRRHDDDDPYLVVAADKGTATFSDHANAVSAEYGFWLGDAFASGGSVGYDHKVMGITARGAWESVKRHFREIGIDTQSTGFTVVGIGDMSGDVFGNGMLLSPHIRLVAAFDHRHVFLDPNPDAATSFAERQRLFALQRSSWADYDTTLLSTGGGIHPRTAKSITITPEVQAALNIKATRLTPNELVQAILKAPVDLLYNGGIGTYVKASSQTHADVGDRANDAVRINGSQLRCKVIGEGGNLGFTQLGRIEFAAAGGRIYTDAIDNSAGVDTSDHEVNIKILLGLAVAQGELTEKQRNALLPRMTDDVAALVLRDNYGQTQVISVTGKVAPQLLDAQQRFMQFLEKSGRLNRAIEFLPPDEEIAERRIRGHGLSGPERAVMLAYSKIWLNDELVQSPLPDDPWVATALERYFPRLLREKFKDWMPLHPLRREIIATHVLNSMINRVGSTFVHRIGESTGARPFEIVRAYLLAREVFGLVPLWLAVEALDNKVDDALQAQMLIDASVQLERGTIWFLRSQRLHEDMTATMAAFRPGVETLEPKLATLLAPDERERVERVAADLAAKGVPQALADRMATFPMLFATLDIVEVAAQTGHPMEMAAAVYFDLAGHMGISWLRDKISALPGSQHWQMLAKGSMLDDLSGLQRAVTAAVLAGAPRSTDASAAALVQRWQQSNDRLLQRSQQLLGELRAVTEPDSAMLSVMLREMRRLG
jgi:glutamate dehydrogenase